MSPTSPAAAARTSASADPAPCRAWPPPRRRRRGCVVSDAEHDLADVGLGQVAQEAQQAGGPAHPEQQHAGGVGVEGAGVADLPGAEDAGGPGPRRRATSTRPACRRRRRRARAPTSRRPASRRRVLPQEVLDALGPRDDVVDPEAQLRGALQPGLAADGRLERGRGARPAPRRASASSSPEGGRSRRCAWRRSGSTADVGDRDQLEALVVDPLELVGDDLPAQLVDPGRARVAARRRARPLRLGIEPAPRHRSTSTSGRDHTNRSTSSSTSTTCDGGGRHHRDADRRPAATGPGGRPRRPPPRTGAAAPRRSASPPPASPSATGTRGGAGRSPAPRSARSPGCHRRRV